MRQHVHDYKWEGMLQRKKQTNRSEDPAGSVWGAGGRRRREKEIKFLANNNNNNVKGKKVFGFISDWTSSIANDVN